MTLYRVLSVVVMVLAVLSVTLPPLAPEAWRMGAAVLAFVLAVLAFLRFHTLTERVPGLVLLGAACLALSFAVPAAGGLSGGLAGAGSVILMNAYLWKTSGKA